MDYNNQERQVREYMWQRLLGPNYTKADKKKYTKDLGKKPADFNPMPEDELKAMDNGYTTAVYTDLNSITLAPLPAPKMNVTATEMQVMVSDSCKGLNTPMKKGKKMYNDYDDCECCTPSTKTDEQTKREYLAQRLYEVSQTKRQEARKMFYMDADMPNTIKEFIERIQSGKFTPPDEKVAKTSAYNIWAIDWHDPAHPADATGYRAARDAFKKLRTETQDQIKIADVADGLKALQALEAWTPTTAAN